MDLTHDLVATAPASTVAVVVCTHLEERLPLVRAAVASLEVQSRAPDEVLVMVDGTEALAELVRAALPDTKVACMGTNQGVSAARNAGAAHCGSDIVIFLDDDAVADPRWVEEMAAPMAAPEVLGACGRSVPRFAGRPPAWLAEEFWWTIGCTYRGMPTVPARVRNFHGGAAAVRRAPFLALGGFDPALGYSARSAGGGEEADFCLRARAHDPRIDYAYAPAALTTHLVPVDRLRIGYFWRRCVEEGLAKRRLARRHPGGALGSERAFALRMPLAAARALLTPGRSGAAVGIVVGVLGVLTGLVRGQVRR